MKRKLFIPIFMALFSLGLAACVDNGTSGSTPSTPSQSDNNPVTPEPSTPGSHTHTWGSTWEKDDTNHWHSCTDSTCKEVDSKAPHTWDEGTVTTKPTEENAGVKTFKCTVCEATKTEEVAKLEHTHKFAEEWTSDETYHWHVATCEHSAEVDSKEEHTGGTATCKEKAKCEVCGKSYGELASHTYGEYIYNGDGTHSRVCSVDNTHIETEACTDLVYCDKCKNNECDHTLNTPVIIDLKEHGVTCGGLFGYTSCECGQNQYINPMYNFSSFECDFEEIADSHQDYDYYEAEKCKTCGLEVIYNGTITNANCVSTQEIHVILKLNDKVIVDVSFVSEYEDHNLTNQIISNDDFKGCFVVSKCEDCGYIDDSVEHHMCNDFDESEPVLSEDADGTTHSLVKYTCEDCAFNYSVDSINRIDGCNVYEENVYNYYFGEELMHSYTEVVEVIESHKLTLTTGLLGETCEDGWYIEYQCSVCNKYEKQVIVGHYVAPIMLIDLENYNCCGGQVMLLNCICQEEDSLLLYEFDCNFSSNTEGKVIDGIQHYIVTNTCAECGLVAIMDVYYTEDGCLETTHITHTIKVNEETSFTVTTSSEYDNHNYHLIDEILLGETCEDGVKSVYKCDSCNETFERIDDEHDTRRIDVDLDENTTCGGYYEIIVCDRCNEITDYERMYTMCDFDTPIASTYTDEAGIEHYKLTQHCLNSDCNMVLVHDYYDYEEECYDYSVTTTTYLLSDEKIFEQVDESFEINHNNDTQIVKFGTSCEDGYVIVFDCKDCGYSDSYLSTYHDQYDYEVEVLNSQTKVVYSKCICEEYSDIDVIHKCVEEDEYSNYEDENGWHDVHTYTCEACKLQYSIDSYQQKVGCLITSYEIINVTFDGTKVVDNEKVIDYRYNDHDYEHSYKLVEGGKSCEDGVIETTTCKYCDYLETEILTGHNVLIEENIDLSSYNICEDSTIIINSCVCGQYFYLDENLNWDNCTQENNSETVDGVHYSIYEYNCNDCELYIINKEYTIIENCVGTNYESYLIKLGDDIIFEGISVNGSQEMHNYKHSYELLGESCEDGVKVIIGCTDCDYSDSYEVDYHSEFLANQIIVKDTYEDCCGFEISYYECACKEKQVLNYEYQCNLTYTETESEDTEGNTHKETVHVCENCGIKIVEDRKYIVDSTNSCIINVYKTTKIFYGSEQLFILENIFEERIENHDYTITHEFDSDENCDNGVLYTYTCNTCQHVEEKRFLWHKMVYKSIYTLEEYTSDCEGMIEIYSCACGQESQVQYEHYHNGEDVYLFDSTEDTYVDGSQVTHTTYTYNCEYCGFAMQEDYWDENPYDCYYETYKVLKFYYGSTLIASTSKEYYSSDYKHDYETTYSFINGEDCEEGLSVSTICNACGENDSYEIYYHDGEYQKETLDLSKIEGLCGGTLEKQMCYCGKEVINNDWSYCSFDYSHEETKVDDEGNEHIIQYYVCPYCSLVKIYDYKYVVDRCTKYEFVTITYKYNEEVIFEGFEEERDPTYEHDYETTNQLNENATSCEDGWVSITTCKKCNEVYQEDTYTNHDAYAKAETIYMNEYDENCDEYFKYNHCLCGAYGYLEIGYQEDYSLNSDSDYVDGIIYLTETLTYLDFNLFYTQKTYTTLENCVETKYMIYEIKFNDEVIASIEDYIIIDTKEKHTLAYIPNFAGQGCEEGGTVYIYCTAENCDYNEERDLYYHSNYIDNKIELYSLEGCCGGYVVERSCLCQQSYDVEAYLECSFVNDEVVTTTEEDGSFTETTTYTCEKCGLEKVVHLNYYPKGNCMYDVYEVQVINYNTQEVFVGHEESYGEQVSHTYSYGHYQLVNENGSCEGGVIEFVVCDECGDSYESSTYYEHKYENEGKVDTSSLDTCEGFAIYDSNCLCGQHYYAYVDSMCDFDSVYEETTDGDGNTHYIYTRTCKNCPIVVVEDFRLVDDLQANKHYEYLSYKVIYNDELFLQTQEIVNLESEIPVQQ